MSTQEQSKRKILKEKVVALVKDFIKTEGGISQADLWELFGLNDHEIAAALAELPLSIKEIIIA
jgi:hypothetical protein